VPEPADRLKVALADRYVIESELGEGGMATVYLAHDVKHNRKVALKVLRPELAAMIGAERFLKEIEVTANLQHPHILPLYDSGKVESDGRTELLYYVMPYVEGESLRDKLAREKQLSVEQATDIAAAVASALDYAHRKDVIHRDIKPENVLLHDGNALVADFGIALAVRQAGTNRLTETGLSLGTPHYMSPEQAMGDRELDARSDIYSLGAMLYEMLVGEPPFTGPTAQSIVAKVITERAPLVAAARSTVPRHVGAVVRKALEKLPADRFADAGAFAEALRRPGTLSEYDEAVVGVEPTRTTSWYTDRRTILLGAALVVVALLGVLGRRRASITEAPSLRFTIEIPGEFGRPAADMALSPTADRFVFPVYRGGTRQLAVRRMNQIDPVYLDGTENADEPEFSPDGEWIAFATFTWNELRKVPATGGPPITLAEHVATNQRVVWADDGYVYAVSTDGPIIRVNENGGRVDTVVSEAGGRAYLHFALPGGRGLLYNRCDAGCGESTVEVFDNRSGETRALVPGGTGGWLLPSHHLVFGREDGSVFAAPLDLDALELTGAPVPVLSGVEVRSAQRFTMAIGRDGSLVYMPGAAAASMQLVLVDRSGVETPVPVEPNSYVYPQLSVDGRRIVVETGGAPGRGDLWVEDLRSRTRTRLTFAGHATQPAWSPDGTRIAFSDAPQAIAIVPSDGSARPTSLFSADSGRVFRPRWTPDGESVVFEYRGDIMLMSVDGKGDPQPLVATDADEGDPAVSPDGRWLAYSSDEAGVREIYLRPFQDAGPRRTVSRGGGEFPHWLASSRELVYTFDEKAFLATLVFTPEFEVTRRQEILDLRRYQTYAGDIDVTPDGRSFLLVKIPGEGARPVMVFNWGREVEKRLAGDGRGRETASR